MKERELSNFQKNYEKMLESDDDSLIRTFFCNKNINTEKMCNSCYPYAQMKTGYCWLAAMLQCISIYVQRLSGYEILFDLNRLIFFDKLEKANMFFSLIIENIDGDLQSYPNAFLLKFAMSDKGQWHMGCNLIKKYGLTPVKKQESYSVKKTRELNACLSYVMRIYAFEIRTQWENDRKLENIFFIKQTAMQKIYNLLVDFYNSPTEFVFHKDVKIEALEYFQKIVQIPLDEYISICADDEESYVEYEIKYDGNVFEAPRNRFLKLPNNIFEELIIKQIMFDGFCWCSGDMGKFYIKSKKMLDDSAFDFKKFYERKKIEVLNRDLVYQYYIGRMNHAVVLLKKTKNNFLFYDSAYSEKAGSECCMSYSWFKKFLFQGIIHRSLLPKNIHIIEKKTTPWDFFGL